MEMLSSMSSSKDSVSCSSKSSKSLRVQDLDEESSQIDDDLKPPKLIGN